MRARIYGGCYKFPVDRHAAQPSKTEKHKERTNACARAPRTMGGDISTGGDPPRQVAYIRVYMPPLFVTLIAPICSGLVHRGNHGFVGFTVLLVSVALRVSFSRSSADI